jgi:hypothetical protein
MRSLVIVALGCALSTNAAAPARSGCSATDYASESIALRASPDAERDSSPSIPKGKVSSLVRVDAFGSLKGDWLQVRGGTYDGWVSAKYVVCRVSSEEAKGIVAQQAADVLQALKTADMTKLAEVVHPTKGLRFSPYASVDTKTDVVLTALQLKDALKDPAKRVWGAEDGSGAPIRLTFTRYYHKFVYDRDFSKALHVNFNRADEGTKHAWENYPNAIVVEYGLPETGSTPREHLLLSFEQHQGKWYLSGIIHDGWTL